MSNTLEIFQIIIYLGLLLLNIIFLKALIFDAPTEIVNYYKYKKFPKKMLGMNYYSSSYNVSDLNSFIALIFVYIACNFLYIMLIINNWSTIGARYAEWF